MARHCRVEGALRPRVAQGEPSQQRREQEDKRTCGRQARPMEGRAAARVAPSDRRRRPVQAFADRVSAAGGLPAGRAARHCTRARRAGDRAVLGQATPTRHARTPAPRLVSGVHPGLGWPTGTRGNRRVPRPGCPARPAGRLQVQRGRPAADRPRCTPRTNRRRLAGPRRAPGPARPSAGRPGPEAPPGPARPGRADGGRRSSPWGRFEGGGAVDQCLCSVAGAFSACTGALTWMVSRALSAPSMTSVTGTVSPALSCCFRPISITW